MKHRVILFVVVIIFHTSLPAYGRRQRSKEICKLSRSSKTCYTSGYSWYYDGPANKCLRLPFGQCNGNPNNFLSREYCIRLCVKDLVAFFERFFGTKFASTASETLSVTSTTIASTDSLDEEYMTSSEVNATTTGTDLPSSTSVETSAETTLPEDELSTVVSTTAGPHGIAPDMNTTTPTETTPVISTTPSSATSEMPKEDEYDPYYDATSPSSTSVDGEPTEEAVSADFPEDSGV